MVCCGCTSALHPQIPPKLSLFWLHSEWCWGSVETGTECPCCMGRGVELVIVSIKKLLSYCLLERLKESSGALTITRSAFMAPWEAHCVGTCFVAGIVTLLQEALQCVSGEWQYIVTAIGNASGRLMGPKPWMFSAKPTAFYSSPHIFTNILLNPDHSSEGTSVFLMEQSEQSVDGIEVYNTFAQSSRRSSQERFSGELLWYDNQATKMNATQCGTAVYSVVKSLEMSLYLVSLL